MTAQLAGFIGLAALMVALFAWMHLDIRALRGEMRGNMKALREEMRGDMKALREEMRGDMTALRGEMRADMKALREEMREDLRRLEVRLAAVEHSQARLEGLLEGLREAIAGRAPAE